MSWSPSPHQGCVRNTKTCLPWWRKLSSHFLLTHFNLLTNNWLKVLKTTRPAVFIPSSYLHLRCTWQPAKTISSFSCDGWTPPNTQSCGRISSWSACCPYFLLKNLFASFPISLTQKIWVPLFSIPSAQSAGFYWCEKKGRRRRKRVEQEIG